MYITQGNIGNCGAFATAYYIWQTMKDSTCMHPVECSAKVEGDQALVNEIYNSKCVRLGTVWELESGGKEFLEQYQKVVGAEAVKCLIAKVYYDEMKQKTDQEEREKLKKYTEDDKIKLVIQKLNQYSLPTGLRNYLICRSDLPKKDYMICMPDTGDNNILAFKNLLWCIDSSTFIANTKICNEILKNCTACIELVYAYEKALTNLHYVLSFKCEGKVLYINPWRGVTMKRKDEGWSEFYGPSENPKETEVKFFPTGAGILIS